MKIKKNFLIIGIIVIVLIIAGIGIFKVINNKKKGGEVSSNKSTNSGLNKLLYDGSTEMGNKVDFEIKKIDLPEKVGNWKTCEINGNTWYYDLDVEGNAINIYTYDEFSGDVIIPDILDGHKVISIGQITGGLNNSLFLRSDDNIISIIVPDGVKYINGYAFYGYDNLEKITLPDSIIYIGEDAFSGSENLAYINSDIEGKVIMPKNLQYYGESLFRYNEKINSFEFPEQIDYIQDWTFYETSGFSDVTISGQFKYIGQGAFSDSKIETLTIEDGVKIIKHSAFSMNKNLNKVNIANTVISIETYAFELCTSLNDFKYNGKLKYIGKDVLKYTNVKDGFKNNQLPN